MTNRFQRQRLLPEIGTDGQEKLEKAKVLIFGAGGIGSAVGYYLTAAGIGSLGFIDGDVVETTNLNRQILHMPDRIGHFKVDSAKKTLSDFNPFTRISTYPKRIETGSELAPIIASYDLIVDCTDNYPSRRLINDTCLKLKKPWVYGAVFGFEGQTMTIIPGEGPCYRCLYPSLPLSSDAPVPVIGVSPGIIGLIQATEALKFILQTGRSLAGRLLYLDLLEMTFTEFKVTPNTHCLSCGSSEKGL